MKRITIRIMTGIALFATQAFAGNGDLIVDGKLGVGMTSPQTLLHLSSATPTLTLQSNSTGPGVIDFWAYNRGYVTSRILGHEGGAVGRGFMAFYNRNDAGTLVENMMIDGQNGNVGIGTTSPQTLLHLSNATPTLTLQSNSTGSGVIDFWAYNRGYVTSRILGHEGGAVGRGFMAFYNRNDAGTLLESMRIDGQNGNIGIGTTNPANLLTLGASGGPTYRLTDTTSGAFSIVSSDSVGSLIFSADHGNSGTSTQIIFQSDGGTERMRINSSGNVGIGTDPGTYKLYVNGPAYSTGGWQGSDLRFKKNLLPVSTPLDKVLNLNGLSYEWKTDEYKGKGFPEGRHYGVIAQEIEKVLPEVVNTAPDGTKAVAYTEIIPVLIEAIKEQQKIIVQKQALIETLQNRIENHEREINDIKSQLTALKK